MGCIRGEFGGVFGAVGFGGSNGEYKDGVGEMKKIIILLLLPIICYSQEFNFVFEADSIPVEVEGWNPYCPWAGGESETSPEYCDIDADGDLDFFNGNFTGKISYFENTGSNLIPDFSLITKDFAGVDLSGNTYAGRTSPSFCDIDNDGDFDLFSGDGRGLIHYWENVGTSTEPEFEWITDSLGYIDGPGFSKLQFIDMDLDDDFDLFIGFWSGFIWYYENTGTPDSFVFDLGIENWEGIDVNDCANPCFIDIDADNDLDLFIGNENGYIWYYRNDGDSANYAFTYVTNYYDSIDVGSYASPEFADIDGDGDYDMFVGSESLTWFFRNIGTPESPQFQLITQHYLTFEQGLKINVVDINGDGAEDLIIGNQDIMNYSENIGTSSEPSFLFIENNFQGIDRSVIKPCFVDLDDDGDYDMLAGEGVIPGPPTIAYYENVGNPRTPDLRLVNENYITNNSFFVNANPGVADIDADGDFDLFVSDHDGHFFFYLNNGNPSQPAFQLVSDQWQGIQFYYPDVGWRGFNFGDIDEDGDLDLLIQNTWIESYNNLRLYRNTGNPGIPNMEFETNVFLPGIEISTAYPYLVDIDDDDDLDLFVGEYNGGAMFFRNLGPNSVNGEPVNQPYTFTLHQNYPNPFNAATVFSFELRDASFVSLNIFNIDGQSVGAQNFVPLQNRWMSSGYHEIVWDASGVSSGVYLVRLDAGDSRQARKVMLVK